MNNFDTLALMIGTNILNELHEGKDKFNIEICVQFVNEGLMKFGLDVEAYDLEEGVK